MRTHGRDAPLSRSSIPQPLCFECPNEPKEGNNERNDPNSTLKSQGERLHSSGLCKLCECVAEYVCVCVCVCVCWQNERGRKWWVRKYVSCSLEPETGDVFWAHACMKPAGAVFECC